MLSMVVTMMLLSSPAPTPDDVAQVARLKVFFGHQSVGDNLLEGVRAVAPSLHVVRGEAVPGAPAIVETLIGSNEDPASKLAHFERIMEVLGGQVDIAMFKFCYIDFSSATNVEELTRAYARTLATLEARHGATRFVHVTVPLTTVQRGVKAWLGRLVGRAPWGELENERRARFNAWMRSTYPPETVFDLAKLETQDASGSESSFERDGAPIPMLAAANTTDGGHLNQEAAKRLATAYIGFLAKLAATQRHTARDGTPR